MKTSGQYLLCLTKVTFLRWPFWKIQFELTFGDFQSVPELDYEKNCINKLYPWLEYLSFSHDIPLALLCERGERCVLLVIRPCSRFLFWSYLLSFTSVTINTPSTRRGFLRAKKCTIDLQMWLSGCHNMLEQKTLVFDNHVAFYWTIRGLFSHPWSYAHYYHS